jgi:hypothetical protein
MKKYFKVVFSSNSSSFSYSKHFIIIIEDVSLCDFKNSKVKSTSEEFSHHVPGFQVRASSLNSQADFFFHIHSKTAGSRQVRLFVNGSPMRMSLEESIAKLICLWKFRCGCLSKEDCEILSPSKVEMALSLFAGISKEDMNIEEDQQSLRVCIENNEDAGNVCEKIKMKIDKFSSQKVDIDSFSSISLDWDKEGKIVNHIEFQPLVRGMTTHFKDVLKLIIESCIDKLEALKRLAEKRMRAQEPLGIVKTFPIEGPASWRTFVGSYDDSFPEYRGGSFG